MANDINDSNQGNDEDNFGLPDIEYKPLEQLEQKQEQQETVNTESEQEYTAPAAEETVEEKQFEPRKYSDVTRSYDEEEKSNAPMVIGIIVALVVIIGAALVWQFVYKPRKAEQERKELLAKQAKERKAKEEQEAKAREEEERRRREAEAANAKPAEGSIETLSARTGRYYVVVSSAVDGDLVMDNAKKLSAKGVSSKIIPPFGKWKFYRLAVGDFDTFAAAQTSADAAKAEYGPATWVMKY